MKLYEVKVEATFVCIAKDEDGAEEAASEAMDETSHLDMSFSATPLRFLPFGWNGGEIPWPDPDADVPEKTVNEWIAEGAAPELTKRLAERKKATPAPEPTR